MAANKDATEMRQILEDYTESGRSLRAFCLDTGHRYSRLQYWRRKLGIPLTSGGATGDGAVEVLRSEDLIRVEPRPERESSSQTPCAYVLRFPDGVEVVIPRGFDPVEIQGLCRVARSC